MEEERILLGISTLAAAAPLKISARFVDQAGVMHSLQTLAAVYTRVELELTTCGDKTRTMISSRLVRFDGRITHFLPALWIRLPFWLPRRVIFS